ncbi:hypothetical protein NE664_01375 [Anaerotignum faecicola]|nr:hypothetical protein [Anaerotignum faecicola]
MENMKYIRMEEFWRFTEWIIENNEKSWQIYDFLFYDTSAENGIKALTYAVENEFFYIIPILYNKINETYSGNKSIKNILFKELSPYFKEPSKFEDICRKIIKSMEDNINSEKINGIL